MQWLITLETEKDLIITCRLMNAFRRKGMAITTLAMADRATGYSMMAVLESAESDVEHLYNFLRCMEGVEHVSYYQHQTASDASFVFIDSDERAARGAEVLRTFPDSRLVFASHGKFLLEVPSAGHRKHAANELGLPEFLPFARVKSTIGAANAAMTVQA